MFNNPERLTRFLVNNKLNANQFIIAYLMYIDKIQKRGEDMSGGPSLAFKYVVMLKEAGVDVMKDIDIEVLIDRGFLIDNNKREPKREYYPHLFTLTDLFEREVFVGEDRFEKFWKEYPDMIDDFKNPGMGSKVMLKGVPSKDLFKQSYLQKVLDQETHDKIMKATRYGKAKNMINCRIDKYMESELYNGIWDSMSDEARTNIGEVTSNITQFVPRFDKNE